MIFKPMSVVDLKALHEKIQNPIQVKFLKSDKLFSFDGEYTDDKLILWSQPYGKYVVTSITEMLVGMNWETYQLHKLEDEADYELALSVFEEYFHAPSESEEGCFAYLLGLTIQDYEAEHYPIASLSTIDFIDYLLAERNQSWGDLTRYLYKVELTESYAKGELLSSENISVNDIIALSHFFHIPVQAFIVGGYSD